MIRRKREKHKRRNCLSGHSNKSDEQKQSPNREYDETLSKISFYYDQLRKANKCQYSVFDKMASKDDGEKQDRPQYTQYDCVNYTAYDKWGDVGRREETYDVLHQPTNLTQYSSATDFSSIEYDSIPSQTLERVTATLGAPSEPANLNDPTPSNELDQIFPPIELPKPNAVRPAQRFKNLTLSNKHGPTKLVHKVPDESNVSPKEHIPETPMKTNILAGSLDEGSSSTPTEFLASGEKEMAGRREKRYERPSGKPKRNTMSHVESEKNNNSMNPQVRQNNLDSAVSPVEQKEIDKPRNISENISRLANKLNIHHQKPPEKKIEVEESNGQFPNTSLILYIIYFAIYVEFLLGLYNLMGDHLHGIIFKHNRISALFLGVIAFLIWNEEIKSSKFSITWAILFVLSSFVVSCSFNLWAKYGGIPKILFYTEVIGLVNDIIVVISGEVIIRFKPKSRIIFKAIFIWGMVTCFSAIGINIIELAHVSHSCYIQISREIMVVIVSLLQLYRQSNPIQSSKMCFSYITIFLLYINPFAFEIVLFKLENIQGYNFGLAVFYTFFTILLVVLLYFNKIIKTFSRQLLLTHNFDFNKN